MLHLGLVTSNPSYERMFRNHLAVQNITDVIVERVAPEVLAGVDFPEYDAYIIRYDDGFQRLDEHIHRLQFTTHNKYGKRSAVIVIADNTVPPPAFVAQCNAAWNPIVKTSDITQEVLQAIPLLRAYEPQTKIYQRFYDEQEVLAKQYRAADRFDIVSKICLWIIILGGVRLVFML